MGERDNGTGPKKCGHVPSKREGIHTPNPVEFRDGERKKEWIFLGTERVI